MQLQSVAVRFQISFIDKKLSFKALVCSKCIDRKVKPKNLEFNWHHAHSPLAQPVEQLTVNQWVAGSSPAGGATLIHPKN